MCTYVVARMGMLPPEVDISKIHRFGIVARSLVHWPLGSEVRSQQELVLSEKQTSTLYST